MVIPVVALLLFLELFILLPPVQKKLRDLAITNLQEQLHADVSIRKFRLDFPKTLKVHEMLVSREPQDTLLYVESISVNIRLIPLIRKKIAIQEIGISYMCGDIGKLLSSLEQDSNQPARQDTGSSERSSPGWQFSLRKLSLSDIRINLNDPKLGINIGINAEHVAIGLGDINPDSIITCRSLAISDTKVTLELLQTPESEEDTSGVSGPTFFKVSRLSLDKVAFDLMDSTGLLILNTYAGNVNLTDGLVDIAHFVIGVDQITLKDSYCNLLFLDDLQESTETQVSMENDLNWGQSLWRIAGNDLKMENCSFGLDYQDKPETEGHFDPSHLHINRATGRITDFLLDEGIVQATLTDLKAIDPHGMAITDLDAKFSQTDDIFRIEGLQVTTHDAKLLLDIQTKINPTDFSGILNKEIRATVSYHTAGISEIDFFYPLEGMAKYLSIEKLPLGFSLDLDVHGKPSDLTVDRFEFRISDSTYLNLKGNLRNLHLPDYMQYNLKVESLSASAEEVYRFLPDIQANDTLRISGLVTLHADVSGGSAYHHIQGKIGSSVGSVLIDTAWIDFRGIPEYTVSISADLQEFGTIMDSGPDRAHFTLSASFEGKDVYDATAVLDIQCDSLEFLGKSYRDILIAASIDSGEFNAQIASVDTNLLFNLDFDGKLTPSMTTLHAGINVGNLDLHVLDLAPEPFRVSTQTDVNLSYSRSDDFSVTAAVHSLDFKLSDTIYNMHPIDLSFNTDSLLTDLHFSSHFYHLDFESRSKFMDLVSAFSCLPGYYLADFETDSIPFDLPEFELSGELDYPAAFARLFFPDLPEFFVLKIDGYHHAQLDDLNLTVAFTNLTYGTIMADSLLFTLNGSAENLKYKLNSGLAAENLLSGSVLLSGSFDNSQLTTNLRYTDSFGNPYLDFTARLDTLRNSIVIQFISDSLLFSYDPWKMNPGNQVELNKDFVRFTDFHLSSGEQEIKIISPSDTRPDEFRLVLQDFNMGSIEQLLALDTVVAGVATADFHFLELHDHPLVKGSLMIDQLNVFNMELGRLDVSEFGAGAGQVIFNLELTGEHESIAAEGVYLDRASDHQLDFNLDVEYIDIDQFNYLLEDYIFGASGSLTGNLRLTGTTVSPVLNGSLNFKNAGLGIKALNNRFTLSSEAISLSDNLLQFSDFKISNIKEESAWINGSIALGKGNNVIHDLKIITDKMEIMNSTRKDNDLIYGLLKANAEILFRGTADDMRVDASVTVDQSTDLTYIFPDQLALNNNDGIVQFDQFDPEAPEETDIAESNILVGLPSLNNYNSRIDIESGTRFQLFFDSGGNNYFKAELGGFVAYNQSGSTSETSGTLEILNGTLHYSIPMVSVEEYTIEPGSYLTLSNELYNPNLKIVASSEVRASTEGLMSGNAKVMMFKVLLYMTGELNDLQLRFDISAETSDAIVSARISQLTEEERNINALNLLVRGSFLLSLHGDEIGSTTTVDAQIDKFYTTHLNHLISENITFVDLKFDVQSFKDYNASGDQVLQRNYYYNIGKSFLNDRARINYKGSLGFTSDLQAEQVNSHFVQNELEIQMKISKDGRYQGVFFRKNKYEGLLEGEVIETGGGLRYSKEMYSIGDLFINEKRRERKEGEPVPEK